MGDCFETREELCHEFKVDLQDKHDSYGNIKKKKARFVARGFSQKEGIDYEETSVPVARYTSIRIVLALATIMKWKIH